MYRSRFPDDAGMHNAGGHHDNDNYTTVTQKKDPSLLDRISETFAGALMGLGIFAVSFFILFANEGRAVYTAKSLDECMSIVYPIAMTNTIYQENNNKLIHLTGKLRTDQALKDSLTGVEVQAIKLRREIQMFQWVEHTRQQKVTEDRIAKIKTDYMYTKEWKTHLVSSDIFNNPHRHINPREFSMKETTYIATHAYLDAYYMKEGLKSKLETFTPYTPKIDQPEGSRVKYMDGYYYTGSGKPMTPIVGDIRISYSYAGLSGPDDYHIGPPEVVSIIAKQSGSQLTKYETEAGVPIEMLHYGDKSAKEMVDDEVAANTALTWMLRAGGWVMMFMGLYLMTNIINKLVSWIPLVRTLVSFGLTIFNLTVSFTLSLFTISLAWLYYRPIIGLALAAVALTPTILTYFSGKSKAEENRV